MGFAKFMLVLTASAVCGVVIILDILIKVVWGVLTYLFHSMF
jgi:hypothetical protein